MLPNRSKLILLLGLVALGLILASWQELSVAFVSAAIAARARLADQPDLADHDTAIVAGPSPAVPVLDESKTGPSSPTSAGQSGPAAPPAEKTASAPKTDADPEPITKTETKTAPAIEARQTAQGEFRQFTQRALREFPRQSDLQRLTAAQVHQMPPDLREAAVRLGQIQDRVARAPQTLGPLAREFYQDCALTADLAKTIRALCLEHARRLSRELDGQDWQFDPEKIPADVVELSGRL